VVLIRGREEAVVDSQEDFFRDSCLTGRFYRPDVIHSDRNKMLERYY
jgi:hypothetical protein